MEAGGRRVLKLMLGESEKACSRGGVLFKGMLDEACWGEGVLKRRRFVEDVF